MVIIKDNLFDLELFNKETIVSLQESDTSSYVNKYWTRLFSTRHMISGRKFSTLVMLSSDDPDIFNHTDSFFTSNSARQFEAVDVVFKCNDLVSKTLVCFHVAGKKVIKWLPVKKNYILNLGHSIRRVVFGQYLINNLRLKYQPGGGYKMELFNMI